MSLKEAREHYDAERFEKAVQAYLAVGRTGESESDDQPARPPNWPATASGGYGQLVEALTPQDLYQEAFALLMMGKEEAAKHVGWSALTAELKKEETGYSGEISHHAKRMRLLLGRCGCDRVNEIDKRIWEIKNIRDQIRAGVDEVDFGVKAPFGDMEL